MKVQDFSLTCNFLGKVGSNHLIQGVMQWELKWCQKMWVQGTMVPKHELFERIPLHIQELNCEEGVSEL
jgi:hypothetical protein